MYGIVFIVLEEWVIETQGIETWHEIKEDAGCSVKDHAFLRRSYYPDEDLVALVVAGSNLLNLSIPTLLEAFGHGWAKYVFNNGYGAVLRCQGSTLRQWLSNLNIMHDHLQMKFPTKKFNAPMFWCQDDHDGNQLSILLYYSSVRGELLVPFVEGIVKEVAKIQFQIEIQIELLPKSDEEKKGGEINYTTWRITTKDPKQHHKLSDEKCDFDMTDVASEDEGDADFIFSPEQMQTCPFTGSKLSLKQSKGCPFSGHNTSPSPIEKKSSQLKQSKSCPFSGHDTSTKIQKPPQDQDYHVADCDNNSKIKSDSNNDMDVGLSYARMRSFFPFHVLIDHHFTVTQVGNKLPTLLGVPLENIVNKKIWEIFEIVRPAINTNGDKRWTWDSIHKIADQQLFLVPSHAMRAGSNHRKTVDHDDDDRSRTKQQSFSKNIKLKGSIATISHNTVMMSLIPDCKNVKELDSMDLTMSDLTLQSNQRDSVFLGEYISEEVNKAHQLDILQRQFKHEQYLSQTLLYNMLPEQVADSLRTGNIVEPKHHENVTLFFSDIKGFTAICNQVDPWAIIDMLNQLYTVMDHLATKFKLYKVETIGDAYVCCSGLPDADPYHAENIANFAIAVMECVKHVKSPIDKKTPIELRIGIHTGSCTSGVVGTLTPHYCLFGDMVNTTARHESTGEAGKIQCSSILYGRLTHFSMYADDTQQQQPYYNFTPRGLVEMKGKGKCFTYWLNGGTELNEHVNPQAIEELSEEVFVVLQDRRWKMRRYFRTSGALVSDVLKDETATQGTRISSGTSSSSDHMLDEDGRDNEHSYTAPTTDSSVSKLISKGNGEDNYEDSGPGLDTTERNLDELDEMIREKEAEELELNNCTNQSGIIGVDNHNYCEIDKQRQPREQTEWLKLGWDDALTRRCFVAKAKEILSNILKFCIGEQEQQEQQQILDEQLFGLMDQLSKLYNVEGRFYNFHRAFHNALCANYLCQQAVALNESKEEDGPLLDDDPWLLFVVVFATLIRGVKHDGVTNEQLMKENHTLFQIYGNHQDHHRAPNYQELHSIQTALSIFSGNFPDLYEEVLFGCPKFTHLVNKAVLATNVETMDERINKCSKVLSSQTLASCSSQSRAGRREKMRRVEAAMELVMMQVEIGHYSQSFETFLRWSKAEFEQLLIASTSKRGMDPRGDLWWYERQMNFFEKRVLPLAEQCERLMVIPRYCGILEQSKRNLKKWKCSGQALSNRLAGNASQMLTYYYFE